MKKSKIYLLIGLGLFVLFFTIYIVALCPTIHPRDNPDIVTAAATLGIAHPPGYPLFTILGNLFSKIPLGSIPFRINLMSALFSAATIFFIYLIILKITKKLWPALIGAAILAFSYYYFAQSLYADLLSLNNLLIAIIVYVLLLWREKQKQPIRLRSGLSRVPIEGQKYLYLAAFLFGLAFSHHQISFFLFPAFLYLLLATDKKIFTSWELPKLIGLFIIGLLPWLYLPIRASQQPAYIWGNPTTFKGFFEMIARKEYSRQSFQFVSVFAFRIFDWLKIILKQFVGLGLILGLIGIVKIKDKDRVLFIFLLLCVLLSGPLFAFMADIPHVEMEFAAMERFFVFSSMFLAIWIGLGLDWLGIYTKKYTPILLILPLALLLLNYPRANRHNYYYAYDLGMNILNSLPQNAVLFGGLDVPLFELRYLQTVEHIRPDVFVLAGFDKELGGLSDQNKEKILKTFPDYNLSLEEMSKKYPVYTVVKNDLYWGEKKDNFAPEGLVYHYIPDKDWPKNFDGNKAKDNLNNFVPKNSIELTKKDDAFTKEIKYFYLEAYLNLGVSLQEAKKPEKAAEAYMKALKIDPNNFLATINYASTLLDRGKYEEAKSLYKEILKKYPDNILAQKGLNYANQRLNQ